MDKSIWLSITSEDGVLIERLDISEYDLNRAVASADIMDRIREAKKQAEELNNG